MPIANRDNDITQRRRVVDAQVAGAATGQTYPLCVITNQCKIVSAMESCYGVSGSPVHSLWLYRFIAGSGVTSILLGATIASAAFGVSGSQTFSVNAAGVTNPLQAGDNLVLYTQGANSNALMCVVSLAIEALQDFQTQFGV